MPSGPEKAEPDSDEGVYDEEHGTIGTSDETREERFENDASDQQGAAQGG